MSSCVVDLPSSEGYTYDDAHSLKNNVPVTLIWYDWLDRSGLFEQVKELASTALSWFDLDEDDHEKIEAAMEGEEPEDRFRSIQNLYLQHARRLWHNGKEREGGLHLGNARAGESGCFLPLGCSPGGTFSQLLIAFLPPC